jgi:hypothetical protein
MNYGTGTVPYIRTSDIANWEIRAAPKHGMSDAIAEPYRAFMDVRAMDVLLVHEGTYLIGTPCLVTGFDTNILFQHHLAKLRASGDRISGPLLAACFLTPIVQRQIRARQFTADVIDSIVGRLPEVMLPLPRSADRRRELETMARECFIGRAEARVRIARVVTQLDDAATTGSFGSLSTALTEEPEGTGQVGFLGGRSPFSAFTVTREDLRGSVLIPRYYDPTAEAALETMADACDLVTIKELMASNVLELQTGDEVGKLAYGSGQVSFIRTSDFGNWELKHDPKQRISNETYEAYRDRQSAKAGDILLVRDGTYLVGTSTIVNERDLPLLFSGGIYRLRVQDQEGLPPALLLALLNMDVVRRQMRNKQFTRDVIDTLGSRLLEVRLPIPKSADDRNVIASVMLALLSKREELRARTQLLALEMEQSAPLAA